jgi:hypothetical protein
VQPVCVEDHLTHQCPRLAEAQKFVTQQQPVVLTNPFQHGKNLTQASTSAEGGSQGPSPSLNNPTSTNAYMMKGDTFILTRAHDYSKPSTSEKGKEVELPSLPLQIEKTLGETMTCIPKGVQKSFSQPKCKGCPELLCGGGFVSNPLCDVRFGGPPKLPFPEEIFVKCFRIYRDL